MRKTKGRKICIICEGYEEFDRFQSSTYSLVLIFCNTDKGPSDKYKEIKKRK